MLDGRCIYVYIYIRIKRRKKGRMYFPDLFISTTQMREGKEKEEYIYIYKEKSKLRAKPFFFFLLLGSSLISAEMELLAPRHTHPLLPFTP
jgi:hypothetical protein